MSDIADKAKELIGAIDDTIVTAKRLLANIYGFQEDLRERLQKDEPPDDGAKPDEPVG